MQQLVTELGKVALLERKLLFVHGSAEGREEAEGEGAGSAPSHNLCTYNFCFSKGVLASAWMQSID